MWWALAISGGLVVLFGGLTAYFGMAARRTERKLGEVRSEREDLEAKLREQARLFDLLLEPDPPLDDLSRMSQDAAAAAGGSPVGRLSEVESRAIDRLLRADPARPAGEGSGG